jgi:hypothetical protein
MLTQTVAVTKVGVLILARLLIKGTEAKLRKELEPFFRSRDTAAGNDPIGETLDQLKRDGLIALKPLALTESGRSRALECLGLDSVPVGLTWPQIKSKYLVPTALGVAPEDAKQLTWIAKADGLRIAILRDRYQLPDVKTMSQALDALVQKALGMGTDQKLTLNALKAKVLSRFLTLLGNPDIKQFQAHLPMEAVKATQNSVPQLQAGVLRTWLAKDMADEPQPANDETAATSQGAPALETAPHRFDLADFASRVRAVAGASETGRFGDNKVFISHVWRALQNENDFPDMTESEFKTHLTEANHAGLLSLSRADLVEVMAPADVEASEARYLHAVFHFIQV